MPGRGVGVCHRHQACHTGWEVAFFLFFLHFEGAALGEAVLPGVDSSRTSAAPLLLALRPRGAC